MYQNKDHTNQKRIVTKSNNIDISNQKSLSEIAKRISNLIQRGDNFFLFGQIGVGKTTFVKFLINHLQSIYNINTTEVLSPTFNILNDYLINDFNIKHYDLYRIKQTEELDNIGLFEDKDAINIIEWPETVKISSVKFIKFEFSYSKDYKKRHLIISSNYNNNIVNEFK